MNNSSKEQHLFEREMFCNIKKNFLLSLLINVMSLLYNIYIRYLNHNVSGTPNIKQKP